jgi:MFS family permease
LHCGEADKLSAAEGIFFVGSLCGFIVLGMMADNLGRRTTLIVCLVSAVVGELLILLVNSLAAVEVGMFLAGFGLENAFNLGFYYFSETLENSLRQRAAVVTQFCFCLGGLLMVLCFYLIGNWQPIFWIFCFVPLFLCLCFSVYFLQETPQFLIKRHPVSAIIRSLRFIATLNGNLDTFETESGISPVAIEELKNAYQR